jgi:hypothetical protein
VPIMPVHCWRENGLYRMVIHRPIHEARPRPDATSAARIDMTGWAVEPTNRGFAPHCSCTASRKGFGVSNRPHALGFDGWS